MSLFQVTKKQVIENYELRTMTGDIVSFTPSYSQLLPDPFSDLNVTVNIVATGGNGTPDNPIPINGYTEANITRCGVNLMHVNSRVSQTTAQIIYTSDDNYIELNGTKYGGTYANLSALTVTLPAGTYYLKAFEISGTATNAPIITAYNGSDLTSNILNNERVLTLNAPTTFCFRFALWTDNAVYTNYKIGIVISTASISEYSEYSGNTYTIAFGQTVYGGVLDVTRGKLTVTHAKKTFTGASAEQWYTYHNGMPEYYQFTTPISDSKNTQNAVTNMFELITAGERGTVNGLVIDTDKNFRFALLPSENITDEATWRTFLSNNNLEICYELATPFDIDLTPEVISAVVGENNVFGDCGNITVKCLI